MASKETWKKCKHFSPTSMIDQWGDPSAIDDELVLMLDDFRRFVGSPVVVTRGTQGTRGGSMHSKKNGYVAVDVVLPEWDDSIFDLLIAVFRFPFTGVGFYPHWRYNGKRVPGLHLDRRPLKWEPDFTKNYQNSRWMGVKVGPIGEKKQVYRALTVANILKYTGGQDGNFNGNMGLL